MHIAFSHPLWLLALLAGPAALTGRAGRAALIARIAHGMPKRNEDMVLTE